MSKGNPPSASGQVWDVFDTRFLFLDYLLLHCKQRHSAFEAHFELHFRTRRRSNDIDEGYLERENHAVQKYFQVEEDVFHAWECRMYIVDRFRAAVVDRDARTPHQVLAWTPGDESVSVFSLLTEAVLCIRSVKSDLDEVMRLFDDI